MKLKGKAKAAFLRKMARGRNKKHHGSAGSKPRRKKTKKGSKPVARKRKHHHKGRKSSRRRSHVGGLGKYLPPTDKLIGIGTAYAYGKVEQAAGKDTAHVLNKVPALVPQIGRTGNVGAILWLAGVFTRHPTVKAVAAGVLHVAAYQNGRQASGFTKDAPDFKMSGPRRGQSDELMVEQYLNRSR